MTGKKRKTVLPANFRHANDEDYARLNHWHIAPFYRSGKQFSDQTRSQSNPATDPAKVRLPIAPNEEPPQD
jgi:hypothetical protein